MGEEERTHLVAVVCRRLDREMTVEEHLACPYCSGARADVERADRPAFCSYEPGKDPICFGFPEGSARLERG